MVHCSVVIHVDVKVPIVKALHPVIIELKVPSMNLEASVSMTSASRCQPSRMKVANVGITAALSDFF